MIPSHYIAPSRESEDMTNRRLSGDLVLKWADKKNDDLFIICFFAQVQIYSNDFQIFRLTTIR